MQQDRLYILEYCYFGGLAGKYSINDKGESPKGDLQREFYNYKERQDFIDRYLYIIDVKNDLHYGNVKCYCIKSLEDFEIDMLSVINAI